MIPMVNLKGQYHEIKDEIDQGLLDALESTQFILGPNVRAFEEEAASYLGVKQAVGCASGTDALHLGLIAAGIGEGDEVITTPFTFIATAEAILYVGAKPVFVDIDPKTFNIDPEQVAAAITEKTKAIIPVHLFGQPADMSALLALAEQHNLKIVEDCAQSFGADIDGRQTGSMGDVGAFSFFPSKKIAEHLRVLRNHGSWKQYHHSELGFNSRLDELQAVILRAKLKRIDQYNDGRRRVGHRYNAALAEMGLTPAREDGIGKHVYHQYALLADNRDDIMAALRAKEIGCAIYYPIPLHQQEVFAASCQGQTLPVTESVAARVMSLPIFPELPDEQVDEILEVIRGVVVG
jgi:dTDP-4-amino-4,6-dideoxygalactose transaminase